MLVDLQSEPKPTFMNEHGEYFCNMCSGYSPNFSEYNKNHKDRRCRECIAKKRALL